MSVGFLWLIYHQIIVCEYVAAAAHVNTCLYTWVTMSPSRDAATAAADDDDDDDDDDDVVLTVAAWVLLVSVFEVTRTSKPCRDAPFTDARNTAVFRLMTVSRSFAMWYIRRLQWTTMAVTTVQTRATLGDRVV